MENKIKKEEIHALLDRREEIRTQINKLDMEFTALGNILTYYLNNEKEKERMEDDGR